MKAFTRCSNRDGEKECQQNESIADGLQVEDECNGMIEYGLHVCGEQAVDPATGTSRCTAAVSRSVAQNLR